MQQFITKHQRDIIGTLSGWDRIRFRGTIRMLAYTGGLIGWLANQHVLWKHFNTFSLRLTATLKQSVEAVAHAAHRTIRYLASSCLSKEDLVKQLLQREGLTEGLVCVLSCVEPCQSFQMCRNRETKQLDLRPALRKCLHWYLYFLHPVLGLCHVRIQSWLPFTVHVCVNGREWLCRQLQHRQWRRPLSHPQRRHAHRRIERNYGNFHWQRQRQQCQLHRRHFHRQSQREYRQLHRKYQFRRDSERQRGGVHWQRQRQQC